MELTHHLVPQLKQLRLSGILDTLDVRTQQAIQEKLSYGEFLCRLIQDEIERRAQTQLQRRLRKAAFKSDKTLESFDFDFNPTINRQQVLDLATCTGIEKHLNLLICGPAGVGKSHVVQGLGHAACRKGYDVLFLSTHKMLAHLKAGRADDSFERRLQTYLRPDLLILDDFGLKPMHPPGPEDLFEVITERYETRSTAITSNRPPNEWPDLFGDPLMASAALDRLAHNAHVLVITGPSYRAKDRHLFPLSATGTEDTR